MKRPRNVRMGEKFRVTTDYSSFEKGAIIKLIRDDNDDTCLYKNSCGEESFVNFNKLELVEKTFFDLEEGDIILDKYGYPEVILAVGEKYILAKDISDDIEYYRISNLEDWGYTIKQGVVELTLEDIANLSGVPVEKIKIIEDKACK